jgi:hypothetical protein
LPPFSLRAGVFPGSSAGAGAGAAGFSSASFGFLGAMLTLLGGHLGRENARRGDLAYSPTGSGGAEPGSPLKSFGSDRWNQHA